MGAINFDARRELIRLEIQQRVGSGQARLMRIMTKFFANWPNMVTTGWYDEIRDKIFITVKKK